MSKIFQLIWKEYTQFGVKVWCVNEEIEFWRSIIFFSDIGTNKLFKAGCYIYVTDTSLVDQQ